MERSLLSSEDAVENDYRDLEKNEVTRAQEINPSLSFHTDLNTQKPYIVYSVCSSYCEIHATGLLSVICLLCSSYIVVVNKNDPFNDNEQRF